MDELDALLPEKQDTSPEIEILIGTIHNWNSSSGATFTIDGAGSVTTKYYKIMQTGRPMYEGKRYLILKTSGTYVVLGEIGLPPLRWADIGDLASGASLADVISKVNTILAILRANGQIKTS